MGLDNDQAINCWLRIVPFPIHTHKNLATVQAHRTSKPAAKHQTTEFLTANKRVRPSVVYDK